MLSEPISPILGITPRWLMQTSRGVSRARYALKVLALSLFCIVLGISTTSLYRVDDSEQPSHPIEAYSYYRLGISHGKYSGVERNLPAYLSRVSTSANAPQRHVEPKTPTHDSMVGKLTNKLPSWKPWADAETKNPATAAEQDDVVSAIYAKTAAQHTKEVIISPWNASMSLPSAPPTLAKITIVTGGSNSVYERALRTHTVHNQRHGYPMHTLRQSILNDVWSKPAYILSVLLRELAKPAHERLQWLFWVDADTIVLNPHVPAETFLPPVGWADDVHLLVAHDFNGLNNGVFPLRVHPWSVDLLAAVLSYPFYRPDEQLVFRDQSAMARVLEAPRFARHTVRAPQRWFNAYQGEINETIAPFQTRPGDLLVHFAGVPDREARMRYWLKRAEEHLPEWEIEFKHTSYATETREFWEQERRRREDVQSAVKKLRADMDGRKDALMQGLSKWGDGLSEGERKGIEESLVAVYRTFEQEDTALNMEAQKKAIAKFIEVSKPLQDRMESSNKILLKEAHDALFAGERLTVSMQPGPETGEDLGKLDEAVKNLKAALLAPVFKPEQVEAAMNNVKQREQDIKKKLAALNEAEEERRLREMAVSGDERKAELEKANVEKMREENAAERDNGGGNENNNDNHKTAAHANAEHQEEKEDSKLKAIVPIPNGNEAKGSGKEDEDKRQV